MNTLFCTPEQGQRLKELLPELTYAMAWVRHSPEQPWSHYPRFPYLITTHDYEAPALNLQELRDVAKEHIKPKHPVRYDGDMIYVNLYLMTAPELAEWVIERLEEGR
jgi:hypothetical protein